MQSFQVLSGKHFEKKMKGQVIRYGKGDIITSLRDLRKLFPNKFELVENEVQKDSEVPFKIVTLGRGQYNVVDTSSDKVLNKEPLTKTEAEQFVKDQMKEIN